MLVGLWPALVHVSPSSPPQVPSLCFLPLLYKLILWKKSDKFTHSSEEYPLGSFCVSPPKCIRTMITVTDWNHRSGSKLYNIITPRDPRDTGMEGREDWGHFRSPKILIHDQSTAGDQPLFFWCPHRTSSLVSDWLFCLPPAPFSTAHSLLRMSFCVL